MNNMVELSFQEMAQIVADHLVCKGRLAPGTKVDITWHWDCSTLNSSYAIFKQEGNN